MDDVKIIPIKNEEYPTKAKRPRNSILSKKKLDKSGFKRLPKWEDSLQNYIYDLKNS